MARDSDALVFSTDGSHLKVCPKCGRSPCACPGKGKGAAAEVRPAGTVLLMRLDKKGRGGKAVTVVYDLPLNPDYFVRLIKQLKSHCGTGGSLKEGGMEIQGDQRDKVQNYLEGMGFTVRRSGG